jgi:hypothetical protein
MERRLEEVPFAWVFRVEQLEHLHDKRLVDVLLRQSWLEIGRLQEAQEKLVDELEVRPRCLEGRLILLWVKLGGGWILRWWERSEQINCKHVDNFGVHSLGDDLHMRQ